jgi:hypothetical protein
MQFHSLRDGINSFARGASRRVTAFAGTFPVTRFVEQKGCYGRTIRPRGRSGEILGAEAKDLGCPKGFLLSA